jgi:RNA polymerase sigma-70 factor, ECF subfamily
VICHILFDVGWFDGRAPRAETEQEEAPPPARAEPLDPAVRRAAAGDALALVALYREHAVRVRTFALRLVGCEMAADDLVHDVFLALPGALSRFRGDCTLVSFLLSITVRSARRHLRAAQRRRRIEAQAAHLPRAGGVAPDADSERRELASLLARALDGLPLAQRAAFILCEVEEHTSQEAGEILGERAGTIRARVFHAKRRLRERLTELAPEHLSARSFEVSV